MNDIKARVRRYNDEMLPENLDSLLRVEAFVKRKLAPAMQGVTP